MGKKLKGLTLLLFSICCTVGFSTTVNAETLEIEMTKDMTSQEINDEISKVSDLDGVIIDGKDEFTIKGGLSFNTGIDVTIKNVVINGLVGDPAVNDNGQAYQNILLNLVDAGNVVVDNVDFIHYDEKGIYAEFLTSLTVTNSTFDSLDTVNIGNNDYSSNDDELLILRSASAIDLNFGNNSSDDTSDNYGKVLNVENITIKGNTFKNVEATTASSTAGAIKIKIKDGSTIPLGSDGIDRIVIEDNTFIDNDQDLVIGTDSPEGVTNQAGTGNFDILLVNNGSILVANNSDADKPKETLEGNYKLNYATDKKYELDENLYYIIDDASFEAITDEEITTILEDEDVAGFTVTYQGLSFAISRETLLDENLGASLDSFDIIPAEETTIEALQQYVGEGVMFFTVSGIDVLDNGMTFDISSLGEEFVGILYLYYYDETDGLQLVANPDTTILTFDKNGTYILSASNLIPSTPSEPTTPEEVPEVPQTFDALSIYGAVGILSLVGIIGSVIYLKRRSA